MSVLNLTGIIPPIVTPLTESGDVDGAALGRVVERVIAGEVSGVFVLGTTGEGPSLSDRQQREAIQSACQAAAGRGSVSAPPGSALSSASRATRVPVLAGISDTCLERAISLAQFAKDCGAAAVVAAPPYYFPMTQADLARWFTTLAARLPLPLVLYNMPACVRTVIEPETLEACAQSPNIVAVKDSSGDLAYFRRILDVRRLRPDWTFLIGPEHLLGEATRLGGDGGVSGGANVAPELFVAMYQAARRGDTAEMAALQGAIEELGKLYKIRGDFMGVARGIKTALRVLGLCGDAMAAPFSGSSDSERATIAGLMGAMDGRVPFRRELVEELARPKSDRSVDAPRPAGVLS